MTALTFSALKSVRSPWRLLSPLLRALHAARQQDRPIAVEIVLEIRREGL